ncbi:MAG: hypothetical protein Q9169_004779 [Polycauliona sp. 2 TL-2023]
MASNHPPRHVKYIPPQRDPLLGSSVSSLHSGPALLVLRDLRVLLANLRYLPYILLPLKWYSDDDELNPFRAGAHVLLLQAWLFVIEAVLLALAPLVWLIFPGITSSLATVGALALVYLFVLPMDGPRIVHSCLGCRMEDRVPQHEDERWIFVNGCVVGHPILRQNIDRLSKIFGRPITGIHNKTYGVLGDCLECLLQRCLDYKSTGVRITYRYVKALLLDPPIKKVVLIGHSQGAIILSIVLDQLFSELPVTCMSKIEIYTFGSAASHFSNPLFSAPAATNPSHKPNRGIEGQGQERSNESPRHVIAHIEHYANEYDMVCRWGVLHCTEGALNNRYAGSVFMRLGARGHMLNQHYLNYVFPIPDEEISREPGEEPESTFLDSFLAVDATLAIKREDKTVDEAGMMQRECGAGARKGDSAVMVSARKANREALEGGEEGRRVRDVSRLWRYLGGRSPSPSRVQESEVGIID